MSIKSDRWIRRMVEQHGMIDPFEPGQVRHNGTGKIISFGTSSYGYDVPNEIILPVRLSESTPQLVLSRSSFRTLVLRTHSALRSSPAPNPPPPSFSPPASRLWRWGGGAGRCSS